jgi:hypothetical protein
LEPPLLSAPAPLLLKCCNEIGEESRLSSFKPPERLEVEGVEHLLGLLGF